MFVFIFSLLAFVFFYRGHFSNKIVQKAYEAYQKGEMSKNREERIFAFNNALQLYMQIDQEYHPSFGDGKLYYNIANSYFQLSQYPYAVLYYYRALALRPEDERVKQNLHLALEKLRLERAESPIWKDTIFLQIFPLTRRLQFFALSTLLFFVFLSGYIWKAKRVFKWLTQVFLVLLIFLSASIVYTTYLSPIEGVILHATTLYRGAGLEYNKVAESPVPSGQKVTVLEVIKEGHWVKITTPDAVFGYVPANAIELI